MKKFVVLLFLFVTSLLADEATKKVVFDFTSGDLKTFEKKILSGIVHQKNHYEGKLQELEVAVVIHGDAYKFFVKNLPNTLYKKNTALLTKQKEYAKRLISLTDTYGVDFFMCEVGRKANKLDKKDLYEFVQFVPNSTIGLIDKQSDGYAYVPISR
ncbi:DsrE family protein [Sulfurimonas sp. C5]|uniref:DsrE family protein n=1 Tax=Sulfurimonas sp. C5 TaxID=3036947 RepID=UPI0024574A03|nr:DsrE family protein [Sulfurimonas sp. C5]MDH4944460.1 DsrE family protein [Sulfurimonas sp. C5]